MIRCTYDYKCNDHGDQRRPWPAGYIQRRRQCRRRRSAGPLLRRWHQLSAAAFSWWTAPVHSGNNCMNNIAPLGLVAKFLRPNCTILVCHSAGSGQLFWSRRDEPPRLFGAIDDRNNVRCLQVESIAEPAVPLPSAVDTKGKWAGRRRPTYNPRLNPLAARSEAAAKISALSDQKSSYYKAKFELRCLEHEPRCRLQIALSAYLLVYLFIYYYLLSIN